MLGRHGNYGASIVRGKRGVSHFALFRNNLLRLLVAADLVEAAAVWKGALTSYVGICLPGFDAQAVVLIYSLEPLAHGVELVHIGKVDAGVHPLDFVRRSYLPRTQVLKFLRTTLSQVQSLGLLLLLLQGSQVLGVDVPVHKPRFIVPCRVALNVEVPPAGLRVVVLVHRNVASACKSVVLICRRLTPSASSSGVYTCDIVAVVANLPWSLGRIL